MGISRRSFLKMVGMASVGLALNPQVPVIANNEIYVNKKLGIAFKIPDKWHFYNVLQMNKMFDSQILKPDAPHLNEYFKELRGQPLASVGMYTPDNDKKNKQFSPSVVLRLEAKDESIAFEDILTGSSSYLDSVVKGFKVIQNSPMTNTCGYRTIKGKYGYLFEAEGIDPTPIIGRSCIIEAESHFYSFNMYNNDPENIEVNEMFDQLESSIMIL